MIKPHREVMQMNLGQARIARDHMAECFKEDVKSEDLETLMSGRPGWHQIWYGLAQTMQWVEPLAAPAVWRLAFLVMRIRVLERKRRRDILKAVFAEL